MSTVVGAHPGPFGAQRGAPAIFTEEQNYNLDSHLVMSSSRSFMPPAAAMSLDMGSATAIGVAPHTTTNGVGVGVTNRTSGHPHTTTQQGNTTGSTTTTGTGSVPNIELSTLDYSFMDDVMSSNGSSGEKMMEPNMQQTFQKQQQSQQQQQQQDCQEFMEFQVPNKEFANFQQASDDYAPFQQQPHQQVMESDKNTINSINFTAQFNLQATGNGVADFMNPFVMQQNNNNMMFQQAEQEMGIASFGKDTIITDRRRVPPHLTQMWDFFKG